jgi:pentatricopeptide repeat protein
MVVPLPSTTPCQPLHPPTQRRVVQVSTLGVDPGDVYTLLVEWCYGQGHAGQALQLLQQMCGRGLHPDAYMDPGMLGAIYQVRGAA